MPNGLRLSRRARRHGRLCSEVRAAAGDQCRGTGPRRPVVVVLVRSCQSTRGGSGRLQPLVRPENRYKSRRKRRPMLDVGGAQLVSDKKATVTQGGAIHPERPDAVSAIHPERVSLVRHEAQAVLEPATTPRSKTSRGARGEARARHRQQASPR